ncbi:hypothetical protein N5J43_07695 [Pseudomonas nicosulfuronedens]|uniref:Uncharacterized protein n=1 Tax=Pseudomonas nicosulfuronedens TaxID=2571105 RepID=A0A5R9R725_9PSED|nr:hypothetical protein [Pseudomonas nicosulfuronedens]MDH1009853.1 hypothetical protein [Pseudomonas nicosulfuronedens]MDH1978829.1 hypothetical protein [Pseudomonas nicosulfuronedens]MDH2028492.1 hypothetical protein [Pseudomonas nicosulfuronedens]TLX78500.1 hypothetical protein FAS41_10735 [Pseudomonas nicosulfuronedens]
MKHFLFRISRILLPFLLLQLAVAIGVTAYRGELSAAALCETTIYVGFACCALAALMLKGSHDSAGLLRNREVMNAAATSTRLWHGLMADLADGRAFAVTLMTSSALLFTGAYLLKGV